MISLLKESILLTKKGYINKFAVSLGNAPLRGPLETPCILMRFQTSEKKDLVYSIN